MASLDGTATRLTDDKAEPVAAIAQVREIATVGKEVRVDLLTEAAASLLGRYLNSGAPPESTSGSCSRVCETEWWAASGAWELLRPSRPVSTSRDGAGVRCRPPGFRSPYPLIKSQLLFRLS